jgi:hypothetical protein
MFALRSRVAQRAARSLQSLRALSSISRHGVAVVTAARSAQVSFAVCMPYSRSARLLQKLVSHLFLRSPLPCGSTRHGGFRPHPR